MSTDPAPSPSKLEIVTRIFAFVKTRPRDFLLIIVLLFFMGTTIIFWLRLNGQTITLPFVDKYVKVVPEGTPNTVTTKEIKKYGQIVGDYKYRCKSAPKNHGGVCRIELITTDNGLQWKLIGKRMWQEIKDSTGRIVKTVKLDVPYQWETTWGDYISDTRIAYRYKITSTEINIEGYAEGTVNNPNYISGNYWQLPPGDPLFGSFEFKRQTDNSDVEW